MQRNEQYESQSAFARRIGRSRSQVSRYKSSGLPTASDGSVPVRAALDWVRRNVSSSDGDDDTLASKKARKLDVECERAELAWRKERGELVDRERAERQAFDFARQVAASWQSWPNRVSPELAAELGCDPATVERALRRKVNEHLSSLSASLRGATE
jgi:transcriptional regulator with XRE-family HTH domain